MRSRLRILGAIEMAAHVRWLILPLAPGARITVEPSEPLHERNAGGGWERVKSG